MPAERPLAMPLDRAALWRRLDSTSLDLLRVQEFAQGYFLNGRILTLVEGYPSEIHYSVVCDRGWVTREGHVAIIRGRTVEQLQLRRDDLGRWWRDEQSAPDLDGVADIDISATPATNTLPIRRLGLSVGESRATDAAWVRFPDLSVERLPQSYTRTAEHCYRYESDGGNFSADLTVDETGIVVRYSDIWERVGSDDSA